MVEPVARTRVLYVHRWVLVAHRQVQKVRKLWKAISHSKLIQIERLRCFLASTENVDVKNTSNAQFGQVLSEIWPSEVFGSQNSCGRAHTGPVRAQTGPGCGRMGPKSQKTLEGHISLKTCPNRAFEVFFGIYRKCRCQKTPQTPDSDKF